MTDRTKTIAYIRVSTTRQAEEGVSLDAQRAKVQQYADLYDLEIIRVEEDAGVSAKSLDRPGLQRALDALQSGEAEALLVCKLDRLTRSVRDLGTLLEDFFGDGCQYSLMSVAEQFDTRTAGGRLVLNILGSVASWEREIIGERTRAAMQYKKSQGEYTGGYVPYGYRNLDGTLQRDEDEQLIIAMARKLRGHGLPYRQIADGLRVDGFMSRSGTPFQAAQVRRMVAGGGA